MSNVENTFFFVFLFFINIPCVSGNYTIGTTAISSAEEYYHHYLLDEPELPTSDTFYVGAPNESLVGLLCICYLIVFYFLHKGKFLTIKVRKKGRIS